MSWWKALFDRFARTYAWRDARGSLAWLPILVPAPAIGVAAIVAVSSFGADVERAIDAQGKELLGADLRLQMSGPIDASLDALVRERAGDDLRDAVDMLTFTSMAVFVDGGGTRLVQVRATGAAYPFYGTLETTPTSAADVAVRGRGALVDSSLLSQAGASIGSVVKIGSREYEIVGALDKVPGESANEALFGPRVFVPLEGIDDALLARGSRVSYRRFYALDDGVDADAIADAIQEKTDGTDVRVATVRTTQENFGRQLRNLRSFLQLVGFVALILGGLGAGSAMLIHLRGKLEAAATLRCLGARAGQVFVAHVFQVIALGVFSAILGVTVGLAAQQLLPGAVQSMLPVDIEPRVDLPSIAVGVVTGLFAAILFALLPLLPLRRVSPLVAVRASFFGAEGRDPWRFAVWGALLLAVFGFAAVQTGRVASGLGFTGTVAGLFLVLAVCARATTWIARKLVPKDIAFATRYGLSGLHRPGSQTIAVLVALGLGTAALLTLVQARSTLLAEIETISGEGEPNIIFFDVQDDQVDGLAALIRAQGLEVAQQAPIITMRIRSVNGVKSQDITEDSGRPRWALRREYRSTYRDQLEHTETIIDGEFTGAVTDPTKPVPISIEQDIAERLALERGDRLVFDVQGQDVDCVVDSIRRVNWRAVRPNFYMVFPTGVLEQAPKFHVLVTRAEGAAAIGALQRRALDVYPNVSSIDVTSILATADQLFDRVGSAIRFMAGFSILAGLLVLVGAVLASRAQRVEESVLLRVLGASRKTVATSLALEYAALGFLAALVGGVLSCGLGWLVATQWFEATFAFAPGSIAIALVVLPVLTVTLGLLNRKAVLDAPPLAALRA